MIYTIGHSTRPSEVFVGLLKAHGVETLVDVRTIPRSRHNPQYNRDTLAATLAEHGIRYAHEPGLGGLRKPRPDSINAGWRNTSFRGYADYMQTQAFHAALDALVARSEVERTAIMCAEAVPWRCHRSLVSDALVARGIEALEIVSEAKATPHKLTSFAKVDDGEVSYPPEGLLL